MRMTLLTPILAAIALAGCSSTGGVADNSDLVKHWNGMHVDQANKLWGQPASSTPDAHGTRYAWSYRGCEIHALVRDEYVVEIKARSSEPDACNIVYAKSRPQA